MRTKSFVVSTAVSTEVNMLNITKPFHAHPLNFKGVRNIVNNILNTQIAPSLLNHITTFALQTKQKDADQAEKYLPTYRFPRGCLVDKTSANIFRLGRRPSMFLPMSHPDQMRVGQTLDLRNKTESCENKSHMTKQNTRKIVATLHSTRNSPPFPPINISTSTTSETHRRRGSKHSTKITTSHRPIETLSTVPLTHTYNNTLQSPQIVRPPHQDGAPKPEWQTSFFSFKYVGLAASHERARKPQHTMRALLKSAGGFNATRPTRENTCTRRDWGGGGGAHLCTKNECHRRRAFLCFLARRHKCGAMPVGVSTPSSTFFLVTAAVAT